MIIYYNGERVDTAIYCLAEVKENQIRFYKEADGTGAWTYTFKDKSICAMIWLHIIKSDKEEIRVLDLDDELPNIEKYLKEL